MSYKYLNLIGYNCPIPVLKIQKFKQQCNPDDTIEVVASDPGIKMDIKFLCAKENLDIISINDENENIKIILKVTQAEV